MLSRSKKRLQKEGLSCGKVRRKIDENAPWYLYIGSDYFHVALMALAYLIFLFIAYQQWRFINEEPIIIFPNNILNSAIKSYNFITISILSFATLVLLWSHMRFNEMRLYQNVRYYALILVGISIQCLSLHILTFLVGNFENSYGFVIFFFFPYSLSAILCSAMLGRKAAMLVVVASSMLCALLTPPEVSISFTALCVVSGSIAASVANLPRRRGKVIKAGMLAALTICIILPFSKMLPAEFHITTIAALLLACLVFNAFVSAIASGLLPFFEWIFKITSNISWIELADLNQPLLKKIMLQAPGTYHHSLMVANLSEVAADAIGCNGVMTRACSYYHDIGKINKAEYFIENIIDGPNPHNELTPRMSAIVIKAHVKDGIDIALRNKLPRQCIDVIREHHGTSIIQYFYQRALDQRANFEEQVKEGLARVEDIPDVNKKDFRHDGVIPQSKESAIISLADAIESASRTLAKFNTQRVNKLIDNIVASRMQDKQLDDSGLTLTDLKIIKSSFLNTLISMTHQRIAYPNENRKEEKEAKSKGSEIKPTSGEKDGELDSKIKAKAETKNAKIPKQKAVKKKAAKV